MAKTVALACLAVSSAAAGAGAAGENAILFFDGSRMASWAGLELSLGEAHLLSEYRDPTSFVGWGYPSTWKKADGSGWRTMYQGWHLQDGKENTKLGLLADSPDAITWAPAQVLKPVYNVSNAVLVNGGAEFSMVFDDAAHTVKPSDRLKCLWGGDTITASGDDGATWHPFGEWTSEAIDPGVSVYRDPWNPAELVITARPQGMRHTDGRHAGYHSGVGWAGLTKSVNERALPLDNVFTKTNEPYGLPSFSYHGNVVSWFWRYACPQYPCFKGGFVSSALAFSYNSQNFTAFGQFPFPESSPAMEVAAGGPVVERGPLNNTDIESAAYGHTYTVFANKTAGALSCQAECDADSDCSAWTYVIGGACCGKERCCRHKELGCPKTGETAMGCVSGAKKAGSCGAKPKPPLPPAPGPPPPPAEQLPVLFPNVNGTLSAGQVYPNTLIEFPEQGRILVHSSASTHQHGFVSTEPKTWSSILTHEIRTDGFTYLSASAGNGSFVSKPILWNGGEMMINADTVKGGEAAAGAVAVFVVELGHRTPSSAPFHGNKTDATVEWPAGGKMDSLKGKTVQLEVVLTGAAKLYALRGDFTWAK